jgi:hypothetical protein
MKLSLLLLLVTPLLAHQVGPVLPPDGLVRPTLLTAYRDLQRDITTLMSEAQLRPALPTPYYDAYLAGQLTAYARVHSLITLRISQYHLTHSPNPPVTPSFGVAP